MKKVLFLILISLILFTCAKNSIVDDVLDETEKIRVFIYAQKNVKLVYETQNKEQVLKFSEYISDSNTELFKCGYTGKIVLIRQTGNINVEYNIDDSCQHFAFLWNDEFVSKKITKEGIKFLKQLELQE